MTVQTKYLQVAINELETVIDELKLQQEGKTNETFVGDCLNKANFIIDNFFQGNQIHSNDALETSFDTVVREQLYWDMTVYEDRHE